MIHRITEPKSLWLTWQPKSGGERFAVGEILSLENGRVLFHYLSETDGFAKAIDKGFEGYPAFKINQRYHDKNVIEAFIRRLPPKSRGDFDLYLRQHFLSAPFQGSDIALLAYTGAKLPSDGFSLVPNFDVSDNGFEYLLEVAGTRYQAGIDIDLIGIGDEVNFSTEPENEHDGNAIAIFHEGTRIGYVNKLLCPLIHAKIADSSIKAAVAKKAGTDDRPLLYVLATIE